DVLAVQSIDGDDRDLGVSFVVNLPASVLDLGLGPWVENGSKVGAVSWGLKRRDGFCPGRNARDQQYRGQAGSCASTHSQIVQDRPIHYPQPLSFRRGARSANGGICCPLCDGPCNPDPRLASMASPSLRISARQRGSFTL